MKYIDRFRLFLSKHLWLRHTFRNWPTSDERDEYVRWYK